ncbi:MAG: heavy metal-binding domain-containing protein [Caldilineaceae bacterium]
MLISLDHVHNQEVEIGELLTVVVVLAANVIKDIRENIRNLVGGRMSHYEKMIEDAVNEAMENLDKKAKDRGYDGVLGVKIANPTVVEGAIEIIAYGNGFKYR